MSKTYGESKCQKSYLQHSLGYLRSCHKLILRPRKETHSCTSPALAGKRMHFRFTARKRWRAVERAVELTQQIFSLVHGNLHRMQFIMDTNMRRSRFTVSSQERRYGL